MFDQLFPGHERQPVRPIPAGPRPGRRYKVKDKDTWETVAKQHSVTARELIANNCGPNVSPEEVNWYLRTRVGCKISLDRRNWAFSDSANPGQIYIPPPGTVPVASQNPKIHTLYGGPREVGQGGVEWLVEFELPRKAQADGWIIQQVTRSYDIRRADGSVADPRLNAPKPTFWEAWPVTKGAVRTANRFEATADGRTYDDTFDQPARPNLKGEFKVVAIAKFYEIALPATFIKQNPQTRAADLPSTTERPAFWDGTGTVHNLAVRWDDTNAGVVYPTRITTEIHDTE